MPSRQRVEQLIRSAFAGVELGEGMGLKEALAHDDYATPAQVVAARKEDRRRFGDTRWDQIPDHELQRCCAAISFLDDRGFLYFLPAFLLWSLRHRHDDQRDNLLHESVAHQFWFTFDDIRTNSRSPRMFTAAQRDAIEAYLEYDAEEEIRFNEESGFTDAECQEALAQWRLLRREVDSANDHG